MQVLQLTGHASMASLVSFPDPAVAHRSIKLSGLLSTHEQSLTAPDGLIVIQFGSSSQHTHILVVGIRRRVVSVDGDMVLIVVGVSVGLDVSVVVVRLEVIVVVGVLIMVVLGVLVPVVEGSGTHVPHAAGQASCASSPVFKSGRLQRKTDGFRATHEQFFSPVAALVRNSGSSTH